MKAFFTRLSWSALLIVTTFSAFSQSSIPDIHWSKSVSWYYVSNTQIASTNDGGIYAAGYKFSTAGDTLLSVSAPNYAPGTTADGGVLGLYFDITYFPRGDSRVFYSRWGIRKLNTAGQEVFKQVWYEGTGPGGPMYPSFDSIKKILGTPDNGYVIVNAENTPGYTYGSLTKYNATGEKRWSMLLLHQTNHGTTPVRGETVINTPDGGLLVTGYLPGVIDDPFNADNPSTGWVGKYDGNGNLQWEKLLTSFPFNMQNRIRSTFAITDACLAADGNGYTLVGSGYAYSSLVQAPPRAILLELDQHGNLKRSNVYDVDPTPAYIALYTGGDGMKYYMLGNTAPGVNNFDYRVFKINTDAVSSDSPSFLSILSQRTFNLSDSRPERLTDLDIASDGGLIIAGTTGVIKLRSEQQTGTSLTVESPAYDCQTGQLTVNTSGGNGTALEYQIIGLRGWSNSNTFNVPDYQRQGTTFKLEARQSGQVVSGNFTSGCSSNPPSPPPTGAFALRQPDYNCETGTLTIQYSNGDGSAVSYRVIGLRDWGASPTFTVPAYQREGTSFLLEARTSSGKTANLNVTLSCGTYTPPPPPSPEGLGVSATFDCSSGILAVNTSGGNGSAIDFKAPGLHDWSSSSQFIVPIYQRNGTTFTLFARQSGQEYSTQYTTGCGFGGRIGNQEHEGSLHVRILPNPVNDRPFTVKVSGATSEAVQFEIIDMTGHSLQIRQVSITDAEHYEPFQLPVGYAGVYLLRVSTPRQAVSVKLLKQ